MEDRLALIKKYREQGLTYTEIGEKLNVSEQRINQLLNLDNHKAYQKAYQQTDKWKAYKRAYRLRKKKEGK